MALTVFSLRLYLSNGKITTKTIGENYLSVGAGISNWRHISAHKSLSISGWRGTCVRLPLLWFMYLSCFVPCLRKPQL